MAASIYSPFYFMTLFWGNSNSSLKILSFSNWEVYLNLPHESSNYIKKYSFSYPLTDQQALDKDSYAFSDKKESLMSHLPIFEGGCLQD